MVRAFTRNNAEVEAEKGGSFKMFDGNIYGEFIDLVSYDQESYSPSLCPHDF